MNSDPCAGCDTCDSGFFRSDAWTCDACTSPVTNCETYAANTCICLTCLPANELAIDTKTGVQTCTTCTVKDCDTYTTNTCTCTACVPPKVFKKYEKNKCQ